MGCNEQRKELLVRRISDAALKTEKPYFNLMEIHGVYQVKMSIVKS
jgi:hypothetical protein